jgi:hypothetical protein
MQSVSIAHSQMSVPEGGLGMQAPPPSGCTPQQGALGPTTPLHSQLVLQGVAQVFMPVPSCAQICGAGQPQDVPHGSAQHAPLMQASPEPQHVVPHGMVQAQAIPSQVWFAGHATAGPHARQPFASFVHVASPPSSQ